MLNDASARLRFEPRRAHVILIALVAIAFYARTADNYWFKDDLNLHLVCDAEGRLDWAKLEPFLWPSHMTSEQYWRPLPIVLAFVDYAVWGANPAGYHIVNLLIHALTCILVYFTVNRLTNFQHPIAGLTAGLAFAVDPINAEAVVWILQRMVLMCAAFSLAALLAWLKGAESGAARWRVIGLLLMTLAVMCKEIAITLPAVFFAIDVLYSRTPGGGWRGRLRQALIRAIPCAVIVGLYLLVRYAIFGRISIRYAGLEAADYARHNRVIERLDASLRNGFVPLNATILTGRLRRALELAILGAHAVAALRAGVLVFTNGAFRRLAAVTLVFFTVSLAPTLWIFWIDDNLFNARFFYQPAIATLALLGSALWLPIRSGAPLGRVWRWPAAAATAALVIAFAIALGLGLRAFDDASAQVRGIQRALGEGAARARAANPGAPEPVLVAFGTPSQVAGVPTIETYLGLLMAPPLHSPRVETIPLLGTLATDWFRTLSAERARLGVEWPRLRYLSCEYDPPGATPLFGAPEPAEGLHPAELIEPPDGIALSNAGSEPVFRFRSSVAASRFVLRIESDEPHGRQRIAIVPGRNAEATSGQIAYALSRKDAGDPAFPDVWQVAVRRPLPRPLAVAWRIETYDDEDRLVGVSADRRMIVINEL
jgi:hypothetical protein